MIEAANKIIDGLKAQPVAFALIVSNMIYLGAGLWVYQDQMGRYANVLRFVAEHCTK